MALTNVQRAFLAGVKQGYRLGRKETRRDVEGLIDELRAVRDEALNKVNAARGENAVDGGRDPAARLN